MLQFLVKRAQERVEITRLFLFGSRARGDHHPRSDYDIAVETQGLTAADWSQWALDVREQAPTLCGIDLVLMEPKMSKSLKAAVAAEGKVFFERHDQL